MAKGLYPGLEFIRAVHVSYSLQIESQEILLYDHRRLRSSTLTCSPRSADFSSNTSSPNSNYATINYSSTSHSTTGHSSTGHSSTQFSSIKDELQWIRQQLSDKEDELARAMNQVEDLTYHLKNVKNFR